MASLFKNVFKDVAHVGKMGVTAVGDKITEKKNQVRSNISDKATNINTMLAKIAPNTYGDSKLKGVLSKLVGSEEDQKRWRKTTDKRQKEDHIADVERSVKQSEKVNDGFSKVDKQLKLTNEYLKKMYKTLRQSGGSGGGGVLTGLAAGGVGMWAKKKLGPAIKILSKVPGLSRLFKVGAGLAGATAAASTGIEATEAVADTAKVAKLATDAGKVAAPTVEAAAEVGKAALPAVAETGAGEVAKQGGKFGLKNLAKLGLGKTVKIAGKEVPILGLLMGLGFGGYRAMKGDMTGAGLEVASGAASTFGNMAAPGVGTAASLAMEGALVTRDLTGASGAAEAQAAERDSGSAATTDAQRTAETQAKNIAELKKDTVEAHRSLFPKLFGDLGNILSGLGRFFSHPVDSIKEGAQDVVGGVKDVVAGVQASRTESQQKALKENFNSRMTKNGGGAAVHNASVSQGVDEDFLRTMAYIESGGVADAKKGSFKGMFQIGGDIGKDNGMRTDADYNDPNKSAVAAARYAKQNAKALKKANFTADNSSLYLAHQQGAAGAVKWLTLAKQGATWEQIPWKLREAALANGGHKGMSAHDFVDLWRHKYADAANIIGGKVSGKEVPMAADAVSPPENKKAAAKTTVGTSKSPEIATQTEEDKLVDKRIGHHGPKLASNVHGHDTVKEQRILESTQKLARDKLVKQEGTRLDTLSARSDAQQDEYANRQDDLDIAQQAQADQRGQVALDQEDIRAKQKEKEDQRNAKLVPEDIVPAATLAPVQQEAKPTGLLSAAQQYVSSMMSGVSDNAKSMYDNISSFFSPSPSPTLSSMPTAKRLADEGPKVVRAPLEPTYQDRANAVTEQHAAKNTRPTMNVPQPKLSTDGMFMVDDGGLNLIILGVV